MNRKVKHKLAWEWLPCWKQIFFHRWKLQEKSTFVYIDCFTLLIMYCCAKRC